MANTANTATDGKKSLLSTILDGAIDTLKRPFIEQRVKRAFESAKDGLEEKALDLQAAINGKREKLVEAAKSGSSVSSYIQELIILQSELSSVEKTKTALTTEMTEFLG
jgi:macrodomain Ter protein organizer (MatP/YcbG family)